MNRKPAKASFRRSLAAAGALTLTSLGMTQLAKPAAAGGQKAAATGTNS